MVRKVLNKEININIILSIDRASVDVCLKIEEGAQFYNYSLAHK